MIYEHINYTSDISYLSNVFIYEYDISKANINVLYSKKVITKDVYDYLYNSERMVRQKYVGMLQKDKSVSDKLQQGIIEAKKQLFESNGIEDYEVLGIKNDAVFIINRQLKNTKFGLINFMCKNIYTSFYKILNLEFYYYYNHINNSEKLDIKGIQDDKLLLHKDYMYQLFKDIFYSIQINGVEVAIRMLKEFYMDYISLTLPIEYYRRFNSESTYHSNSISSYQIGFEFNTADDNMKNIIDISYNAMLLIELQKILYSMYFDKHK